MIRALIISSLSERYYYDAFVKACRETDIKVGILDPEHFIKENHSVDIHLQGGLPEGTIEVVELGNDTNSTTSIDISAIKVAWHLRVNRLLRVSQIRNIEKRFKWSETLLALNSVCNVLPCKWINTIESIERLGGNKLLQQVRAAQVGLNTPDTIISNSPEAVTRFSAKNDGHLLLKSMGNVKLDRDGTMALYSEIFRSDELGESADAIRICPVYAQEYIPKRYEYRVMFIGDEIHACRINSQASKKTIIDWRHYDFDNVEHIEAELPTEVLVRLTAFMRSVDLSYGAIDMIETPSGEFVFLEVNPSGQWEWIAELGKLPIADSVARMIKSYA
ncbi:MAG: hypothetical protein A2928_00645 [Candidatus Taylorbacteria bacterium RIFCSPLOWO2_01_FULL_45_15b]|uniref:ATP-grasp domain-containing protein n=1 Tax=Candidatus Taylorbacteria bacterium RIFCSPLOWO2_01_FULL_45_15b TaxID=1802319 RepID=A0A1G2NCG3_9BACT|nr:MAG: hypothetical protein A2928_00645 [Candidatus Taylorbacteria bacterium RIFCSPLOWO2_01_FULL_45_15b]